MSAPAAPWIGRQLQVLLAQRGHAWLLHGPSGLGQAELALALVTAWLCDRPTAQGACGQCPSCHGVAVRTHPDLLVLMPETDMIARGWPLAPKAQKDIDDKKRKPSKEIRIDALREAIDFAQRTSARGRGKAVLVYPADRMNTVSANALLKTLEEPPGDVRFVLATEADHLLPPTIRSRCLLHAMSWPAAGEATDWLLAQGVAADEAPTLLRAAGGRAADALAAARARLSARQWAQLPRALAQGDAAALADVALPQAVERLQKLCHDLIVLQVGGQPRFFERADLPSQPLSLPALTRWWTQLAQAARSAEHPWNAGLATEALVSAARLALHSKAGPFVPAPRPT